MNKDIFTDVVQSHSPIIDQQWLPKKICPLEMIDTDIDMHEEFINCTEFLAISPISRGSDVEKKSIEWTPQN